MKDPILESFASPHLTPGSWQVTDSTPCKKRRLALGRQRIAWTLLAVLAVVSANLQTTGHSAEALKTLWQIGQPDHNNAEFALAPKSHGQFKEDGFYVVGSSDPKSDWPYVHPGPQDSWAGSRQHVFTVMFGLKSLPAGAGCKLIFDLLDTHSSGPPRIRASINGRTFEKDLPKGAGDETVLGNPQKGRSFRWELPIPQDILRLGNNEISLTTVSGSWFLYDAVRFEAPAGAELCPVNPGTRIVSVSVPPVWLKEGGKAVQPLKLMLRHIGNPTETSIKVGSETSRIHLQNGLRTIECRVPAEEQPRQLNVSILAGGQTLATTNVQVGPPRIRDMWLLPHSHVDIGYTHRQDEIIDVQVGNLERAMQLAQASATNPPGMRFKWNPEAVWSLDHFLKRATPQKREEFLKNVRDGYVGVDALYGNMLTALCRPEELAQGIEFGARLSNLTGRPVLSASICDVPGYTWGIVPLLAQAGVKYFAIGPNFGDRVGTIHVWDDKPFYWKSQSGRERILCWVVDNYHHLGNLEEHVLAQIERQGRSGFPYETSFIFWVGQWPNGAVDNAPPDEQLVEKVLAWNAKYAAPRVIIGLTGEFFQDFERKHGAQVP
ncbi:MAG TPA: polysaccharide lyase family protein, partial [Clostridia bacterium]|nr:polysaccharide lyase family protein [Clostridia bacterium]